MTPRSTMSTRKSTHGGARTGAGRPAIYQDRGKISVVMEQKLIHAIDARAARDKTSRSQVVAAALAAWLKAR